MNNRTDKTFKLNPGVIFQHIKGAPDKDVFPMKRGPQINTEFISPRLLHGSIQIM